MRSPSGRSLTVATKMLAWIRPVTPGAALALLLERLWERRPQEVGVDLSAASALEASIVRLVTFHIPEGPPRRGTSCGSPPARAKC